jgi:hypothetical protein
METPNKESTANFFDLMNNINYFTKLKPDSKKENWFNVELKVSGYNELNLMVADLLKASILALDSEAPYISNAIINPEINVMTLLEIALQLLPHGEMELLDELHQLHLQTKKETTI